MGEHFVEGTCYLFEESWLSNEYDAYTQLKETHVEIARPEVAPGSTRVQA